jgi:hypothetical protein
MTGTMRAALAPRRGVEGLILTQIDNDFIIMAG